MPRAITSRSILANQISTWFNHEDNLDILFFPQRNQKTLGLLVVCSPDLTQPAQADIHDEIAGIGLAEALGVAP